MSHCKGRSGQNLLRGSGLVETQPVSLLEEVGRPSSLVSRRGLPTLLSVRCRLLVISIARGAGHLGRRDIAGLLGSCLRNGCTLRPSRRHSPRTGHVGRALASPSGEPLFVVTCQQCLGGALLRPVEALARRHGVPQTLLG